MDSKCLRDATKTETARWLSMSIVVLTTLFLIVLHSTFEFKPRVTMRCFIDSLKKYLRHYETLFYLYKVCGIDRVEKASAG